MRTVRRSKPFLEILEQRRLLSFSPVLSDPVGAYPQSVVAEDFNNDGNSDLATANANDSTLSVLLGDGQAATRLAVGTYPRSLAVANFNNDSNPDLMFNDGSAVGVLLGNGGGTFQMPVTLTNNPPFSAAAAGDFNKDGNSDIVVFINDPEFDYGYGMIDVRLGDGHGGFPRYAPHGSIFFTARQHALAAGDLNGDGNLDVITSVGNGDGAGANALLGRGDGTFGSVIPFFTGGDAALAIADFTGDGIPDLVSAGIDVAIQVGHGDGTFALPFSYSANGSMHTGLAVADFNGDGKLDVVTSDADTGTVSLLLGNGNGALTYAGAYPVDSSPSAITVGDFNGDFWPDVAAANAGSNTVSVLLNDQSWPALRVGDANGDGKIDAFDLNIVAAHWQQNALGGPTVGDFTGSINGPDGKVNAFDLNLIAAHWQEGVTPVSGNAASGTLASPFVENPSTVTFRTWTGAGKPLRTLPPIKLRDPASNQQKHGPAQGKVPQKAIAASINDPGLLARVKRLLQPSYSRHSYGDRFLD